MAFGRSEFVSELNKLGVNVSRETLQRLETYAALLVKWQARINLVGPATLPDLWRRHFLDSAQLVPILKEDSLPRAGGGSGRGHRLGQGSDESGGGQPPPRPSPKLGGGGSLIGEAGTMADLGSGAGFPGLVLAIMTDWQVHLIDSDQRKCAFLRQVALECGILDRVTVHAKRAEQVTGLAADIVAARACAPLGELLELAAPLLAEGGRCLFLKGANVEEELTQARRHWTMRLDRRASISDPAGVILVIAEPGRKASNVR